MAASTERSAPGRRALARPAAAAIAAGAAAGLMYGRTLLPGLDFGDTGSFQTIAALPFLAPRHAYPLYFALGKLTVALVPGEPAFALNVLSAALGAAAIAAFAWMIWELTEQAAAALWAALLLAGSYTFWSQAIIAEVYTLHVLLIAAVLVAAIRWRREPSLSRLALLYGLYALSFGNHLSMILLAPALLFLVRDRALTPRAAALALALAAAGALQYLWNFEALWLLSAPRPPLRELLATFWFDVTKSDWRETLVGTVPASQLGNRAAMYWWELRHQFGIAGVAIAVLGAAVLARASAGLALALALAFATTFTFAFFYNVGDTHVFLLPSHVIVAAAAGVGISFLFRSARGLRAPFHAAAVLLCFAVPLWRIADTWPAVDRSHDRRPERYVQSAIAGLTADNALYFWDFNWQIHNGVAYHVAMHRPELPRVSAAAVLWHLPALIERTHALGRDVVLTASAAERVRDTYGDGIPIQEDRRVTVPDLEDASLPDGTPYALVWMTPLSINPVSRDEASGLSRRLAGRELPPGRYVALAGLAGGIPVLAHASDHPFRVSARLPRFNIDVRIDAWLPADTMRRAGFGHIVVNRRRGFTVERGLTLVAFDEGGQVMRSLSAGGLMSPQRRFVIPVLR
jgi:hypothetical protein